ncbi:CBS domain-containing protein [Streptomyces sp. NPDC001153]
MSDAARMMERHRVDRLPVVDGEDRILGIATRRGLLRSFLRTDEEIRRQVIEEVLPGGRGAWLPEPDAGRQLSGAAGLVPDPARARCARPRKQGRTALVCGAPEPFQ